MKQAKELTMEVTIPATTTATIHVPAKGDSGVTESGTPAARADGVKLLRMEDGAAVHEVRSGRYRFKTALSNNNR